MAPRRKILAFAAGVAVAFVAGLGLGGEIDPVLDPDPVPPARHESEHHEPSRPEVGRP